MIMADFNKAFKKVLKFEGGYVNDKSDSGGETKYGISKKAFPNLDIKNLTSKEAKEIYKKFYWDRIRGDKIKNQKIAELIFDTAVNMGVSFAIRTAQKIIGVKQDAIIGPITLGVLNKWNEEIFIKDYKLARIAKYVNIAKGNNIKFLRGWIKRVLEV
jgi:lysozyme family protein